MTTTVIIGDTHCGSRVGLTPPQWQGGPFERAQKALWSWYIGIQKRIGKVDNLLCLGDMIDGRQEKNGGNDLIVTSRQAQCDIAAQIVRGWKARKIYMVRGTPYHCGAQAEEWEDGIAVSVDAEIDDRMFVNIDGYVFDLSHHVAAGRLPHTATGGIEKEGLHNLLWATRADGQPKADVLLRGHSHIYKAVTDRHGLRMLCPALQLSGSKYGISKCRGLIDIGLIVCYTRKGRGGLTWQPHLAELPEAAYRIRKA